MFRYLAPHGRKRALSAWPLIGPALLCLPAAAEDAPAPMRLDQIVIHGEAQDADAAEAREDAAARPGNVSVVTAEAFADTYAVTLRDTLQFTPGVIAQPRFGEEVRLSIRGSGVANNAHLRGVELTFDGVPINGADGFGDFQEIDPSFTNHISVFRGANAFSEGAATLGGAIAFSGISALNTDEMAFLRVDGGSFGTLRTSARVAFEGERSDLLIAATRQAQDGFRTNAKQSNGRVYAQAGWRWSDRVETRVGILGNDVNQEIPGALTIAQALTTPEIANPNFFNFRFARDINGWRGWTRTTIDFGDAGEVSVGAAYTDRQLYHPVSIVIDQHLMDHLLFARWDGAADLNGLPVEWTLGTRWRDARTAARSFRSTPNRQQQRGAVIGNSLQYAGGLDVYGELRVTPVDGLTLIAGANSIETERTVRNLINRAASDSKTFDKVSPKAGLIWSPSQNHTLFANISGVFEPPTFGQLTQGGFVTFVPIAAQEGTSREIGARGTLFSGRIGYEIAAYDVGLENEFIAFQVSPLIPAATFNADDTVHRGIEAGAVIRLAEDVGGGALDLRGALTVNDFRFDGDAVYGDNKLAGVPESVVAAEISWSNGKVRLAPSVYIQSDTWVDFRNTLKAPGHTLWNLSASWSVTDRVSLFVEGRNLTDEAYISMVSSIANARAPGVNLSIATPGDGRAIFGGLTFRWGEGG